MKKPIIIVTAGRQPQAALRGEEQTVRTGCDIDYIDAVVRAGGAPLILPCFWDRDAVRAIMEAADGVILTGGGDVVSLTYGEEPHIMSKYQDPLRDEMEFAVACLALDLDLPLLAICRGTQVLNVALGGTLIQDVPTQVPEAVKHYSEGTHTVLLHNIDIEPGSLLAGLLQTNSMAINSYHHQAVKDLGRGLRVNCRARDGVIEGVESVEGKPVLGVQFHPEEAAATYPRFQALFDWVVREARADRRQHAARAKKNGHPQHHPQTGREAPSLPEVTEGMPNH